tara:strand:+ start:275 stop:544 length:270 start_codon:yes stop_codon:yes gene_type:complete
MKEEIIKELLEKCSPYYVKIIDDSHAHKGHKGVSRNENTHFKLEIVSDQFLNKTQVKRHQYVYELCDPFFKRGLHALSLNTMTIAEWKA